MSDAIDAMLAFSRHRGPRCWRAFIEDAELGAVIDQALGRADITSNAISQYLKTQGLAIGQHAVSRHRRKDCGCSND
jgi:hypothetical protein